MSKIYSPPTPSLDTKKAPHSTTRPKSNRNGLCSIKLLLCVPLTIAFLALSAVIVYSQILTTNSHNAVNDGLHGIDTAILLEKLEAVFVPPHRLAELLHTKIRAGMLSVSSINRNQVYSILHGETRAFAVSDAFFATEDGIVMGSLSGGSPLLWRHPVTSPDLTMYTADASFKFVAAVSKVKSYNPSSPRWNVTGLTTEEDTVLWSPSYPLMRSSMTYGITALIRPNQTRVRSTAACPSGCTIGASLSLSALSSVLYAHWNDSDRSSFAVVDTRNEILVASSNRSDVLENAVASRSADVMISQAVSSLLAEYSSFQDVPSPLKTTFWCVGCAADGGSTRMSLFVSNMQVGSTNTLPFVLLSIYADADSSHVLRSFLISLAISISSLLISSVVVFVTYYRFQRGFRDLIREIQTISHFDFSESLLSSRFSELSPIQWSLWKTKVGLVDVARYLPPALVPSMSSFLSTPGGGLALEPTSMVACEYFWPDESAVSLSGSMPGGRRDPLPTVEACGQAFDRFCEAVLQHGGIVASLCGVKGLAHWNSPTSACAAALNATVDSTTGLGVHCGAVLRGVIGSAARRSYTIGGPNVEFVVTLAGLNRVYGTKAIASQSVYAAAKEKFLFRPLDVVAAPVDSTADSKHPHTSHEKTPCVIFELVGSLEGSSERSKSFVNACTRALDHYLAREFEMAQMTFSLALGFRPNDPACALLSSHCDYYLAQPPPPHWMGVYVCD